MTSSPLHVAQINIGTMVAPTDDPRVAEFMDNLDRINAEAEAAPGFVWRLQTEEGNATAIQIFPNPLTLVNMSVWTSADTLKDYVYQPGHVEFFRRRAEWFEPDAKRVALWWVTPGTIPELDEAVRRVAFLERHGPSPYAFGFGRPPRPLVLEATSLGEPETMDLIHRLDGQPGVADALALDPADVTGDRGVAVRARLDGTLVGCGAVRRLEPDRGRIVFTAVDPVADQAPELAAAIIDQLELRAARLGLTETC